LLPKENNEIGELDVWTSPFASFPFVICFQP